MLRKIIIFLLAAAIALGLAAPGTATGAGPSDGAAGGSQPPPLAEGAGRAGAFVAGEVLAPAGSEEQALDIAAAYGLKLKSYAYGIAVIEAPDPELAAARSQLARGAGAPALSLNLIYSFSDCGGAAWPFMAPAALAGPFAAAENWHHELLDTQRAWGLTKGAGVVVAVIDTGIDISHPAFAGRILANSYNSHSDRVGLQYVRDDIGHGTHVAGIVAASSPSASGIAPEASILAIKSNIPDTPEFLEMASALRGINYAVANGARVINLSYGSPYADGPNQLERDTIAGAVAKGATVVCAAGNSGNRHADFPAAYPETIAVSALAQGGIFDDDYSSFGPEIDLSAPGTNVYSTLNGGRYGFGSGTSMAAPNVSGAAALVIARNPGYGPAQVRAALRVSARQRGALGHDAKYGHGIVNAYSAVLGAGALHSVDYDFNDGARAPVTVRVVDGSSLFEPSEPLRGGFVFDAWDTSSAGGSAFDFGTAITAGTTLYALWAALEPGTYAAVFPDAGFRQEVLSMLNGSDGGSRTPLSAVTAGDFGFLAGVASLDLSRRSLDVGSLAGIEHFAGLKELDCRHNSLEELDVSKNTVLETLWCDNNSLAKLDLSGCPLMKTLSAGFNLLDGLDLSGCALLEELRAQGNLLAELDLSGCALLETLDVGSNKLKELDTSKNSKLGLLLCQSNAITSMDLSSNGALETLWVFGNSLTRLDVTNKAALEYLLCYGNSMGDDPDRSVAGWRSLFDAAGTMDDGSRFQYFPQDPDPSGPTQKPTPTSAPPPPVTEPPPPAATPTPAPTPAPPVTAPPAPTPAPSRPNPFTDVNEGDWFYSAVRHAYLNNLFGGTTATTFSPGQPMTRAMFATVLWRLAGNPALGGSQPPAGGTGFVDVAEGAWYSGGVTWAAQSGIVSGIGGGRFDPGAPVTREQMAVMLVNYFRFKGQSLGSSAGGAAFADEGKISGWAKDSVLAIQRAGLIGGKPGNLFDPQGNATRAEVAAIFSRMVSVIK